MSDQAIVPATAVIRPGPFGQAVAADSRRVEFDLKNEVILAQNRSVDTVFIGDSITHFWELSAFFAASAGLLVNRGISGDTTEFIVRRFAADVVQLCPRRVIILAGINDLWGLEAFPWIIDPPVSDPQALVGHVVTNLRRMVDASLAAGIQPVLCSILPTAMEWTTRTAERNRLVAEINRQLREAAQTKGIPFVDYHARMVQPDGLRLRPGLSGDGLHPHFAGYRIMAETLLAGLPAAGNTLGSV